MHNPNNIDQHNETTERADLLQWIPKLVNEKLDTLSTNQLRILHYILGYDAKEVDVAIIAGLLESYDYNENTAHNIANILKRDGMLVMERPY